MKKSVLVKLVIVLGICSSFSAHSQEIPLPEHPRPDFMRPAWENLNGTWEFEFDTSDTGIGKGWPEGKGDFRNSIMVPFPWGSRLSGVEDRADIGWYRRTIRISKEWEGRRIFLTIGASDWETTVWLDGILLGSHRGGYVPFSFELTDHMQPGEEQLLVIRVDDARRDFTLYGKQGYGNVRGIWQTVYLEARGKEYLETLHFTPDIDLQKTRITVSLPESSQHELPFELIITTPTGAVTGTYTFPEGSMKESFDVGIPDPRLWELDDPYLYEVEARLGEDTVKSYFGMRKISVMDLPGSETPYIALNNRPVYMQLTLDQSYHPDGFYTFPSDRFIREEILRSKSIGLTGIRTHIKVEVPRKLYWADKLGLLVMEDLPNSWGEPDEKMKAESEYTLREMIRRDYNHPSIFYWVLFNETWGLFSTTGKDDRGNPVRAYTKPTQYWVASMYYLAKSLDQTRLVEDNSICCGRGHTETDVNSWHIYLPGWEWDEFLRNEAENTYEGSPFNFEEGFRQARQPNINSECGNVWGYDGSTGDVDWSWDYHRMINTFREYPKIGGWLYTEHHDVINEWNGYWRFDRSEKETGLGEIMEGMRLNDLHSPVYLSTGNEICRTVRGGERVEVPLFLSSMTGAEPESPVNLTYELTITNVLGEEVEGRSGKKEVAYAPWMQSQLEPLSLEIPDVAGLAVLKLTLSDGEGTVLHRNFMHFEILSDRKPEGVELFTVPASGFSEAAWSRKQWEVLDGKKVNGAGNGYFQYEVPIPDGTGAQGVREAYFLVELSAKQLFVKDMQGYERDQDFMLGSRVAPSANPNSYPMTDQVTFPSTVKVLVGGEQIYSTVLPDDPADHRGVLSWHHQLKDRKLREAGSYGYLIRVPLKNSIVREAIEAGVLKVRLETEGEGGIAVYGREFGRYPVDPSLVLIRK